jgi:hypothetical protein
VTERNEVDVDMFSAVLQMTVPNKSLAAMEGERA